MEALFNCNIELFAGVHSNLSFPSVSVLEAQRLRADG